MFSTLHSLQALDPIQVSDISHVNTDLCPALPLEPRTPFDIFVENCHYLQELHYIIITLPYVPQNYSLFNETHNSPLFCYNFDFSTKYRKLIQFSDSYLSIEITYPN